MDLNFDKLRIAVLVPCYNEELTVTEVVKGFREALPQAYIYVFDNNSTDATRTKAVEVGAKCQKTHHRTSCALA